MTDPLGIYQQVVTDERGRIKRIINWFMSTPPPPGTLHYAGHAYEVNCSPSGEILRRLHGAPRRVFDWATECPADLIRRWPPIVGGGRGYIMRSGE